MEREKKNAIRAKFKLCLLSHLHTDGEREVGVIVWLLVSESYLNCWTQSPNSLVCMVASTPELFGPL